MQIKEKLVLFLFPLHLFVEWWRILITYFVFLLTGCGVWAQLLHNVGLIALQYVGS